MWETKNSLFFGLQTRSLREGEEEEGEEEEERGDQAKRYGIFVWILVYMTLV